MYGVTKFAFFQLRDQLTAQDWPLAKKPETFSDKTKRGIQSILAQFSDEIAQTAVEPAQVPRPGKVLEEGFKSDVAHYAATLAPLRKRAAVVSAMLRKAA